MFMFSSKYLVDLHTANFLLAYLLIDWNFLVASDFLCNIFIYIFTNVYIYLYIETGSHTVIQAGLELTYHVVQAGLKLVIQLSQTLDYLEFF